MCDFMNTNERLNVAIHGPKRISVSFISFLRFVCPKTMPGLVLDWTGLNHEPCTVKKKKKKTRKKKKREKFVSKLLTLFV